MLNKSWAGAWALMWPLLGCGADLGTCDESAALELVYDQDGIPAFAGQALIIESCGGGGFCHSENIASEARFGAPLELDFDLTVVATSSDPELDRLERQLRNQVRLLNSAGSAWGAIESGSMPPSGAAGQTVLESIAVAHDRVLEDGLTFERLPSLDSSEGQDIVRNYLACGVPVIERTLERNDGLPARGFLAPQCERFCVDPTWPSIQEFIVEPRCALSACHDSSSPEAGLDLSLPGDLEPAAARAAILDRMVGVQAEGTLCRVGDNPLLTPSDPTQSLFYTKVAAATSDDVCGSLMPLSGSLLSQQRRCAIEAWIQCGACADPTDTACNADIATCVADARETCGIRTEGGSPVMGDDGRPQCVVQEPCSSTLPGT